MEPFRTEVAISRMYRVCQECSGFIGTARLCPHSFSPPVTINLLPFVFNGVIVTGGEKKWGWRGPSCQLEIARVLE
ncbi:hypothetical protein J6590_051025 [Homalodisca vitripennis]|nr:hypothetical protein J6590_051025 [Homalodisca vitripennis]